MEYRVEEPTRRELELMDAIERELEGMTWPTRVTRRNIGTDPNRRAFVLGRVRKLDVIDHLVPSRFNDRYPALHAMFRELMRLRDPTFRYNAIQVNANVQTAPHYDRNNRGPSYCLGLGRFRGGGLTLYAHDAAPTTVCNRRRWVKYDGSRTLHASAPVYGGTRYAIIYFRTVSRAAETRRSRTARRGGRL